MKKLAISLIFLSAFFFEANAQNDSSRSSLDRDQIGISAIENDAKRARAGQLLNRQPDDYVRPDADERFKRYLNRAVGTGLIGVGISSTFQQIGETPPEWKQDGKGFARRLGSNFGENVIEETVAYGIEESLKLDSKFYKSKKRDLASRVKNGLLSGITARTPSGKRVFNPAPIIGKYTSNIVAAEVWYPKRFSYKDGLREGTQSVAFSIGFGLLNEFLFKR